MEVRNRTWPVWPCDRPAGKGRVFTKVALALAARERVSTTPALVPIQSRSLHANRAVMRKQAALCWRMMASDPVRGSKKGVPYSSSWHAFACKPERGFTLGNDLHMMKSGKALEAGSSTAEGQ